MHSQTLPSGSTGRISRVGGFTIMLFLIGSFVNMLTYQSIAPIAVALIFFLVAQAFLIFTPLGGEPEQYTFSRVFGVNFVMAGVAAIYANQLGDSGQLYSDAAGFYEMATGRSAGILLAELQTLHEGALGIIIWRAVYDFFELLGFEKLRYVGVSVNVTAVALAGVFGVKILRVFFGNDHYRFRRLTLFVSACGLLWLFAGMHLRDSIIFLAVAALTYVWVAFLSKPASTFWFFNVVAATIVSFFYFGFLRGEFAYVPLALIVAASAALIFGQGGRKRVTLRFIYLFLGIGVSYWLLLDAAADLFSALERGLSGYRELSIVQHDPGSLGISLIVDQALPVRVILGSIYLFVFPIPFWSGLQLDSAYALFKSANVVFFYFLIPLLLVALFSLYRNRSARTPATLFIAFVVAGFTLAIAGTSLETRHFGAFLIPIFVFAMLPDLRNRAVKSLYIKLLTFVFSGVLLVHLTWAALKFL